jgi:hypothetical protein
MISAVHSLDRTRCVFNQLLRMSILSQQHSGCNADDNPKSPLHRTADSKAKWRHQICTGRNHQPTLGLSGRKVKSFSSSDLRRLVLYM